ncbi:MAG: leucine-rich repeat protein, partial [Clostridia bacterium]|nr:leucine-rich repeat protein [Clostridia bacterium]
YSVDDGFKNELYASYLVDGQYTTPVALTEYGSHVSCFDVDYYNGQVVLFAGLDNLDNDTDDFPYGTTDLVFESFGETTDLTISDAIYYDEDSIVEGGTAAFTTFITNQGTSTINSATLSLSDSQGVVNSVEITEAILPGETREVEIEFAIPDDYECSVLSFEVSTDNDCESTNNSAEITIGKADIVLTDYAVDNGKIIGKVSNVGFEDADDVKIQIDNFDTEYTSLSTISVGTIVGGETKEFEYELSAEYTSYINYTDYDEFDLEISTSTPEANYENNHCIIIGAPIRVESITLNYSEVDVRLEDTVALIATVEPVNAMNRNVIWISDSTDIATVDENGVVTTYARGTAIISAITEDGDIVASCTVNVYSDFEFEKINNTEIRIIGYTGSENNLVIPDTLEGLPVTAIDAEFTGCTFETVHLGSNITEITSSSFNGVNTLTEITVDSANTTYLSDDGVLFTLDGTTMLKYPQGKPDTDYLVAETITSIGEDALINVTNLENITVPYYVSNISSGSFEGCSNINVNCYENSPAHNYCVENSIPYTLIIHNENEHEFSITTYVNPTCVSVGYTKHTCWICGDSYTDTEIEATGHNYEAIVTAPTCTEGGYITYICSVCGDSYIADETLALGHTEADVVVENLVKETCLEDGSYDDVIYCSTCSVELERTTVVIPSLGGHTEGDWEITTAPDCIIAGERIIKCTVCDEILQTEEIPATGHDESWKVTVKPTCKRTGTKIKYCLICDRTISTESVDIVDCEAGDWLVTIQPSCKSVGTQVKQCIYCTTVLETEQIPMIEHSAGDWEIVAEATCTSVGEKVIKCANCKTILETKELPMTEHIAGDWEIATEATCISAGEKIVKCTYCDEPLETEGIPATGVHNINDWQITTEPTTEIVGESVKKCTVCNTVFESKEIPILTDTSGFCGNDLLWNYDTETKTLTITGTGAMFDYTATTRPWEAFEDDMTTVILSDDVTYIGRLAFYHSSTLTTVDMGGVTTIGATAFGLCTTLTNIEIGSNVATINIGAFNGCTALESIIIPESLTTINNTVFNNCKALTDVYYAGLPEQWNSITIGANNTYLTDATFHYHYGQPHSHEEWNITREATCTEVGSKTRSCLDCGKTEIVEISAIGHTACDWIVTVEVTCLSDGEKIKKCTVCEELLETEIIGATGHNYEAVITESSCLEGGFTTYTCSYCADVYVSDETESLGGHSVVDGVCKQCGEIIQSVIFDLKWDKEEYLPGETAQLSIYMNVADSLSLGTGAITIGLDSNTILQDDNLVADTKASITTSELFDSFWKTPPTMAWQSATIANKISNSNTQEENETYDQYLKILFARNTSGSHENASNSKNGIYGYEFNSEEPIMTLSFVVASDVTQGVNLNAAITSGSVLCTPIQIYFKYYVDPGNATTTKNLDATTIDISQACATASISDGTSECVHENITETEDIILLPTCVTDGEKTISVICDDCGEAVSVISEMIPTTGHDFNAVVTVPTCISQGYTTYTCSCGECYISDYIDSTEHCYDNGICLNCGGYRPCVFVENGMYVEGLYYNLNTLDWVKNNVGIGNISIEIYNINNEKVSDDDLVGTGATVYIYDSTTNELLDTYTVVLYGDVNGDGIINDTDKEIITYVATCTGTIDNKWCLMAADTNHDGAVDSFDVIETQLQTLDMHNIEQINNSAYIKEDSEDEEVA